MVPKRKLFNYKKDEIKGKIKNFIIEICAGFYLDDEPIFQFKKVRLILEDNDMVSNINSDTFCVKEKWFVGICTYKKEEKEIRVPQKKVKRIEYYDKQF